MPTGIWSSRWRSGSAHWDLELAVEVRQCPLGSGARGGGPAVPTGILSARRRRTRRRMRRRRRRRTALIKSNNPHLAGGEKHNQKYNHQKTTRQETQHAFPSVFVVLFFSGLSSWRVVFFLFCSCFFPRFWFSSLFFWFALALCFFYVFFLFFSNPIFSVLLNS